MVTMQILSCWTFPKSKTLPNCNSQTWFCVYWMQTSQELRMLSLSLFIQGSLWMMRLLFSIARNVISVSHATNLEDKIIHSGCFLNVIVLIVFIVLTVPQKNPKKSNFSVRSCLLITLIKCLKGHRSLRSLFVKSKSTLSEWVSQWQGHLLSCFGQLKTIHENCILEPIYKYDHEITLLTV